MDNFELYKKLLGKFKGREMADELISAVNGGDTPKVIQVAHALRGTAGNLGFPILNEVTEKIEVLAKGGESSAHLIEPLNDAIKALEEAIAQLVAPA